MKLDSIRNFCIIAHIDHGKSTLADRFLETTGAVDKRKIGTQMLDTMEIEQERGITIKLQPVRMEFDGHELNLIDTPGHVDFTYEVSRSLAAVEGAILLVDAAQGVQAQTIANLYLALEQDLTIIPVLNKIDLPAANVETVSQEIINLLGCAREDILAVSAKTGEGVEAVLKAVIERVPAPDGDPTAPLQALIFDSYYDEYKGVVANVRIVNGLVERDQQIHFIQTDTDASPMDVAISSPSFQVTPELSAGSIGMIATGLKDLKSCRVGDTIINQKSGSESLAGYQEVKSMVFAGIFPAEGNDYGKLRESLEKLVLSDSALSYEPEQSDALGVGFRCGFLGMLHLEIVQERLRREHNLEIVVTVPSVAYEVTMRDGKTLIAKSPQAMPDPNVREMVQEPWVRLDIISNEDTLGGIMQFVQESKGLYINTEYLEGVGGRKRVILHYDIPLSSILTDFYDNLKSISSGYASMNYDITGHRETDVVKLDIMVADEVVEALSQLVSREEAYKIGKMVVTKLKETLPRQQFVLKLQATIGGKVIAGDRLSAMRKDVTAKLYGGDVTRKRKLLEKQKKGKKRMMASGAGKVKIPPEAYLAVLKRS